MAINITGGQALTGNDTSPGIVKYWINTKTLASTTPATGGPITAFTTTDADGLWQAFENYNAAGNWSKPASAGGGGLEYILTANYRVGGLSDAKLATVETLLTSSPFAIIGETGNGKYYLLSQNASATTATPTSGAGGGGGAAAGTDIVFTATDAVRVIEVTVTTTLDAITD